MSIVDWLFEARIGNYGPHVFAAAVMVVWVFYLGWKMKLPNWQFVLFVFFAWQLHEVLSQIPLTLSHGTFTLWALSSQWWLSAIAIGAGLYFFHPKMKLQPLFWAFFLLFILAYSALGWPITFPPNPVSLPVAMFENAYHIYFITAFGSLFL